MSLPKLPLIITGIILLTGLVIGVVLVQRPQIFQPEAAGSCQPWERPICLPGECKETPDCDAGYCLDHCEPRAYQNQCVPIGETGEYDCRSEVCTSWPNCDPLCNDWDDCNPSDGTPTPTTSPVPTLTPTSTPRPTNTPTPVPPGTPTPTPTTPPTPTPTLPLCPKPGDLNLHCIWDHDAQCFKVNLRWNPVSGVNGYTWELYKNPDRPPDSQPLYAGDLGSCGRTCDAFSGCVNEATATSYWGRVTGHNSCQVNWAASLGCTSINPPSPTPTQEATQTPTPTEPPICPKPEINVGLSC